MLELYFSAKSKIIWPWVPTCHSTHSWQLYSVAPLRNQTGSTMTQYPVQSHYPDTEPTSPSPILLRPSTMLGSNKHQFYKSPVWLDWVLNSQSLAREAPCFTNLATTQSLLKKRSDNQSGAQSTNQSALWVQTEVTLTGDGWRWFLLAPAEGDQEGAEQQQHDADGTGNTGDDIVELVTPGSVIGGVHDAASHCQKHILKGLTLCSYELVNIGFPNSQPVNWVQLTSQLVNTTCELEIF